MSDVTLNGSPVIRGDLKRPFQGAITAELDLEADVVPSGQAQLQILGEMFAMSVVADPADPALKLSGDSGGFQRCLLVAGAGGLQNPIAADERAQGAIVGDLLRIFLDGTGEEIADDIDPLLLGQALTQWSWVSGTAESALSALCEYLGVIWRIRADGKVWIGKPVVAPRSPPDYIVTDIAPETGQASWALNDISVKPDDQIEGLTIRQIIYSWEGGEYRAVVTFAPGPVNGLFFLMGKWLARMNINYFRLAGGRVAGQTGNSAQFQPDSSQISPLRKTGLRFGFPDSDVQGLTGGRGVVGWEGASPIGPITMCFGPGPVGAGQLDKIRVGLSSLGPPAGTQPLVTEAMRTAQADMDGDLAAALIAAAVQLIAAGNDPTLVSLAPLAAAALVSAGTALGAAPGGAARAIQDFEAAAVLKSNFLTTIFEAG